MVATVENDEDLHIPRDAKIVKSLLQSIGIDEYEHCVVHHMLELWYKYAGQVLTDTRLYSMHAGKGSIDSDDIELAIQSKTLIFPNYQIAIPEKQSLEELEQDKVAKLNPSLEQSMELGQYTHQRVSFPLSRQTK
ncbi:hypothetical protein BT93_J0683 [Corymbia citriodora subsp. variegata]|nr:hypothetical protein BT93_J0683 [Corymbia citriodora subsp. variegata]